MYDIIPILALDRRESFEMKMKVNVEVPDVHGSKKWVQEFNKWNIEYIIPDSDLIEALKNMEQFVLDSGDYQLNLPVSLVKNFQVCNKMLKEAKSAIRLQLRYKSAQDLLPCIKNHSELVLPFAVYEQIKDEVIQMLFQNTFPRYIKALPQAKQQSPWSFSNKI